MTEPVIRAEGNGTTATGRAGGALSAMICGITGLVASGFPVAGLVLGIIAILQSVNANREIEASGGRLEGREMALAGLVCGIIATAIGGTSLVLVLVFGSVLLSVLFALIAG